MGEKSRFRLTWSHSFAGSQRGKESLLVLLGGPNNAIQTSQVLCLGDFGGFAHREI